MSAFLDRLAALGAWSLDGFWLPVVLWTAVAAAALMVDRAVPLHRPLLRRDLLAVVLVALPVALGVRVLVRPTPERAVVAVPVPEAFEVVVMAEQQATPLASRSEPGRPWGALLAGAGLVALLVGTAVTLAGFGVRLWHLRRLTRGWEPSAPEETQALAERLAEASGTRRVALALHAAVPVPMTFGVRRPVVAVPAALGDDPEALRLTLLHELAHVRHGDILLTLAVSFGRALMPWHPLAHVLARRIKLHAEHACDAAVLAESANARRTYAALLTRFATSAPPALVPSMAARPSHLRRRLMALKATVSLRRSRTLAVAGFVVLAATLPVAIRASVLAEPELMNGTELSRYVAEHYPEIAFQAGITARVDVRVNITREGIAQYPRVVRSDNQLFDYVALNAAARARFRPLSAPTEIVLTVHFQERRSGTVTIFGTPPAPPPPSPPPPQPAVLLPPRTDLPSVGDVTSVPDFVPVQQQPVPIEQAQPEYPEAARTDGVEGRVTLRVHVRADGTVGGVQAIRVGLTQRSETLPDRNPYEEAFVLNAIDAIQRWRFSPAMQNDRPVAVMMTLPIRFRQRSGSAPRTPVQEAQSQRLTDSFQAAAEGFRRQALWMQKRGTDVLNGRTPPVEADRLFLQFHLTHLSQPLSPAATRGMSAEQVRQFEENQRRMRQ
ncbi:MAG TPA: M56 family metallopeptidase, partial [Rhodothermales bacterium]|nr:M56 family metallopeptidase [Rhodothermales bacterium]